MIHRTMTTRHIQAMLRDALKHAKVAETDNTHAVPHAQRAAQLAQHAAAELEDEIMKCMWPEVCEIDES